MKKHIPLVLLALCACTPKWDMQGVDPKDYYAEHPIKNRVETRSLSQTISYSCGQSRLDEEQYNRLRAAFSGVTPEATDMVRVSLPVPTCDGTRRVALVRAMHSLGYGSDKLHVESSRAVPQGQVQIDVTYLAVVSPRCPDWRTSPVTTYSNTHQGNFACAQETNVGLMVADPHDLVRGTGDVHPDTRRSSKVLSDYRNGKSFGQSGAGSGSANGNPASGSASAVSSGVSGLTD